MLAKASGELLRAGWLSCLIARRVPHSALHRSQAHPEASKPARQGSQVYWTSGTVDVDINADPSKDLVTATNVRRRALAMPCYLTT